MIRAALRRIVGQEELSFVVTNLLPRVTLSRWIGRFSRIENPLVVRGALAVWGVFSDLDLRDAAETQFTSLRACFTRRLRDGARPIDPNPMVLVSPCDGIVGACGTIAEGRVLQVKGRAYTLADLLGDATHARELDGGTYVTLRLTSAMYHRFHAPHDCRLHRVTHIPGGRWNVNPATLKRVARVFCRNERAVIRARLDDGTPVTLVAVAAILVGGIRLRGFDLAPGHVVCDAAARKGEELGWFEHGSTIIVLVPAGFALCANTVETQIVRMGDRLLARKARGRAPGPHDLSFAGPGPRSWRGPGAEPLAFLRIPASE